MPETIPYAKDLPQLLIEHMDEGLLVVSREGLILFANDRMGGMLGYQPSEMLGKSEFDFMTPQTREKVRDKENKLRSKGKSSKYEATFVTKEGAELPVLISATPLPDGSSVGMITDLTEMKANRTRYQLLVEHMNEAVQMLDKEEKTVYVNPKFLKLTGYKQDEILGKPGYKILSPSVTKEVRKIDKELRAKGKSSSYEITIQHKDGHEIPVLISGTPLPGGGSVAIMTDLTKLKEKEKRERSLSKAIEYASDSIIIFDSEGSIQTWNKGAKTIFGYRKEEVVGNHLKDIFHHEQVEKMLQNSSEMAYHEIQGKHKNQHDLTISATLTPIFDDHHHKIAFCLLIGRDITNKSKVDDELAIRIERIKEAYSQMGFMRRQMDYMFELLDLANQERDPKVVSDFIVRSVFMLSGADAAMIRKYNPQKETLEMLAYVGVTKDWAGKATIHYEGSLAQKAFEKNTTLKIIDVAKEPRYQSLGLAKANNLCSMMLIPLQYNFQMLGTLSLYMSAEKKLEIFEDDFIERYGHLAEMALGQCYLQ